MDGRNTYKKTNKQKLLAEHSKPGHTNIKLFLFNQDTPVDGTFSTFEGICYTKY